MDALQTVSDQVKWLRQQQGLTQANVADRLTEAGLPMDPSQLARIERGERDVRVGELLLLAVALGVTPADLLTPRLGKSLQVGVRKLTGSQVVEWFRGNRNAVERTFLKTVDELRDDARKNEGISDLLESIAMLVESFERRDFEALVVAATYAHTNLAALTQQGLSKKALQRIWAEYMEGTD